MMTVAQAAKALNMSRQRIHVLIYDGRIKAKIYGAMMMVMDATIAPEKNTYRPPVKHTARQKPRKEV